MCGFRAFAGLAGGHSEGPMWEDYNQMYDGKISDTHIDGPYTVHLTVLVL